MLKNIIIAGVFALIGFGFSNDVFADEKKSSAKPAAESPSRYSDKVPGLKEQKDFPPRPKPIFELFQDYVNEGEYCCEFELPTGMIVSPGLLLYGFINAGLEVTDNGVADTAVDFVTRLDLFMNLTLSGTERILVGISPLERESGPRTRYSFQPESGFQNEMNLRLTTAFFEGELSEIFPKIDWLGRLPLDYEFSFGRQRAIIQDGILINDTMDSIAVTRSTIPFPGSNFARIGGFVGVNNVQRSNQIDDPDGELYGIFSSADIAHSTVDLDLIYVDSSDAIGDQFNIGASFTRAFIFLERSVDTKIHLASSFTPDQETAQATDGTLLYASFSWAPKRTDDIMYVNLFGATGAYAPASRERGGPLSLAGLLFSGNGLAGPAISNRANDTYGGAIGYQLIWPALDRNLVFEIGGKEDNSPGGIDRFGAAVRYSQKLNQHTFFEVGGFAVKQDSIDEAYGIRTKLNIAF
jgi:hypothetical protein